MRDRQIHEVWFVDNKKRFEPSKKFEGLANLEGLCQRLGVGFLPKASVCEDTCEVGHSNRGALRGTSAPHSFWTPARQDLLVLHTSNLYARQFFDTAIPGPVVILTTGDLSDRAPAWNECDKTNQDVRSFDIGTLDRRLGGFLSAWNEVGFDRELAPWWILEERSSLVDRLLTFDLLVQGILTRVPLDRQERVESERGACPAFSTVQSWLIASFADLAKLSGDILPGGRFLSDSVPSDEELRSVLPKLIEVRSRDESPDRNAYRSQVHGKKPKLALGYLQAACRLAITDEVSAESAETQSGAETQGPIKVLTQNRGDLMMLVNLDAAEAFHQAFLEIKRIVECLSPA